MADLKFAIIEHYGILSESEKGWTKELNLVSWNEHTAKYDIRDWSPDKLKMGRGITLSQEEFLALKKVLNQEDAKF